MNVEHQFLNICKICKKVYKDKGGLLDHQRLQHSQSQVQQLAMSRFNKELINRKNAGFARNFTGKDERCNNGEATKSLKSLRMESYATLQKPPASLKPKLQSRAIQLSKKESSSATQPQNGQSSKSPFDFEDNEAEAEEWKKWEPEKEKELGASMIISASVAHSTAACYSPTGQSIKKPFADIGKEPIRPQPILISSSSSSSPAVLPNKSSNMSSLKKSELNQQQLGSKSQVGVVTKPISTIFNQSSTSSIRPTQQLQSSGGLKGGQAFPTAAAPARQIPRIPIPKLMSKTKAQFQILKSQATRPKIFPRSSANNALPRVGDPPIVLPVVVSPPTLIKQADLPQAVNQERFLNPPQLLREQGDKSQKKLTKNRLPPPRTRIDPTQEEQVTPIKQQIFNGGGRGRGRGGRGGRGRGGQQTSALIRRESVATPSGSDSDSSENSDSSEEDGPPPAKRSAKVTSPTGSESSERIFGKDYKCPPVNKVASYLNKKGVRVWICLVCEQTEEEISRGPMICCDTCEDWYHFSCVGIDDEPPDDEKWYCKRCIYKSLQSKLQKTKVSRARRGRGAPRGKRRS